MNRRTILSTVSVAIVAAVVVMEHSTAAKGETFTGTVLLNNYDPSNTILSDQDGGGGFPFARHDTPSIRFGGSNRPWLPAFGGTPRDIMWTMLLSTPLTVDHLVLSINSACNGSGSPTPAPGSRIEYTTDPTGLTGWTTLKSGLLDGPYNLVGGTDFTTTTVSGLRWVLPTTTTTSNGVNGWAMDLDYLQASGTNTVPVDKKLNILETAHASVSTGGTPFNFTNLPSRLNDNDYINEAVRQSGAVAADTFVQIALDERYMLDQLWINWGFSGDGASYTPGTYDIAISKDGVNWSVIANDRGPFTQGSGINDHFLFTPGASAKFIRIQDMKGFGSGGGVILDELAAFVTLPEPASLGLLAMGLATVLVRPRVARVGSRRV